jgi:hypothetical protein
MRLESGLVIKMEQVKCSQIQDHEGLVINMEQGALQFVPSHIQLQMEQVKCSHITNAT